MQGAPVKNEIISDIEFPIDGRGFMRSASNALRTASQKFSGNFPSWKGFGLGCLAFVFVPIAAVSIYAFRDNIFTNKLPELYMLCEFQPSEGRLFRRGQAIIPTSDSTDVSVVINRNLDIPQKFTTGKPLTKHYKPDGIVTCNDTVTKSDLLAKTWVRDDGNDYLLDGESVISFGKKDGVGMAEIRLQSGSLVYRVRGIPKPPTNIVPSDSSPDPVRNQQKYSPIENSLSQPKMITKIREKKIYVPPPPRPKMQRVLQRIIGGARLDEDQMLIRTGRLFSIYVKGSEDSITCFPSVVNGEANKEASVACDIIQRHSALIANQVDKKEYLRGQSVKVKF
jgi:hypothetical protein